MTTAEMFLIIRLLSAMESAMYTAKVPMPDHLSGLINQAMLSLEQAIVKQEKT